MKFSKVEIATGCILGLILLVLLAGFLQPPKPTEYQSAYMKAKDGVPGFRIQLGSDGIEYVLSVEGQGQVFCIYGPGEKTVIK